jgi:hypothetical protein
MPHATEEKRRQYLREYGKRKRREARERQAQEKVTMDRVAAPPDSAPPVLVAPGDEVPAAAPGAPASTPSLAPLPSFGGKVPDYQPFRYDTMTPLSPKDRATISVYSELYMQPPGIRDGDWETYAKAVAAAKGAEGRPGVLALMERQLRLELQYDPQGTGAEVQSIRRNIAWVQELLRRASEG